MTLTARLRELCAFDPISNRKRSKVFAGERHAKLRNGEAQKRTTTELMIRGFHSGIGSEHTRLKPILDALIDSVDEIESAIYNQECEEECDPCGNNKVIFENLNQVLIRLRALTEDAP